MKERRQTDKARLESLAGIDQRQAESLQDGLACALDEMIALSKSEIGYVYLYDAVTKKITLGAWSGNAPGGDSFPPPPAVHDLNQVGLWGEVVRRAEPLVSNEASAPDSRNTGFPDGGPSLRRFMVIPALEPDGVAAVVGLANKKTAYTDGDARQMVLMTDAVRQIIRRRRCDGMPAGRDITERKKSEADLKRHRDFIVNIADACFEFDLHARATFCNEAAYRMLGYTEDEYLHLNLHERFATKEQADRVFRLFNELYQNRLAAQIFETEVLCKDGSEITMEMSVSLIRDEDGAIAGFRGVGRDITARKAAQAELTRYRDFIENIGDGCFEIDLNGTILYVNEAVEKRLGYRRGDLIGASRRMYTNAPESERMYAIFKQIYETGEPATIDDFVVRNKEGGTRYVSMTVSLIRDAEGRRVGFRGTTRDHTEKKLMQDALEQSEMRYRNIFQRNKAVMLLTDPATGIIVDANAAACAYYGYERDKLLGLTLRDISAPSQDEACEEAAAGGPGESHQKYAAHRLAGGDIHPVEIFSGPISIGGKELLFSIIHDITARRQAELGLRRSEEKYRSILDNISEGYFESDLKGRIVYANDSGCALLGYDKDAICRISYHQFCAPQTRQRLEDTYRNVLKTGEYSKMGDYEMIRNDGAVRVHQLTVGLIRDAAGRPTGFRTMSRDITEKKQAEELMHRSEEKYRSIMESILEGYIEHDLDGYFKFINDAACTMMGYPREELLSMNYRQIASSQTVKLMERVTQDILATGAARKLVDYEIIRKDGTRRVHQHNLSLIRDAQGKPAGIRAMSRDVTELKWAEEALRQSEERIRLLFRNIPVPTFVWKSQHDKYVLSEFNSAAFQFIGDKIIDSLGKPAERFFANLPQVADDIARCMDLKKNTENQFWYNFDDRSEKRYVIVKYAFAPPDSVLMHVNDITGQKRAEENLQFISIHDSLTGLFNRFYSDAEINRLAASRMRPVSIIVIDLNNLKKINDEYGHAMGDLYIKNAANILKQTFRPEDMIARTGGDEFLVLLPMVDEQTCAQAIERLNEYIRLFNQESEFPLSLSTGAATTQAGDNLLERIREADKRMYEDKAAFKASGDPSLRH